MHCTAWSPPEPSGSGAYARPVCWSVYRPTASTVGSRSIEQFADQTCWFRHNWDVILVGETERDCLNHCCEPVSSNSGPDRKASAIEDIALTPTTRAPSSTKKFGL